MMLIPTFITLEDQRREARISFEVPDFLFASFRWAEGLDKARIYESDILTYSGQELALLLPNRDRCFFEIIKPGDRIPKITLFAEFALTMVDGILRHKVCIEIGPDRGLFVIDLETETGLV